MEPIRHSAALSIAELHAARQHSTGTILPAGLDYQGRYATRPMPAEACTDLGTDTRPAALSMQAHRSASSAVLSLLLIPCAAAVVAVVVFAWRNWPA